jgi:hypothetical protein
VFLFVDNDSTNNEIAKPMADGGNRITLMLTLGRKVLVSSLEDWDQHVIPYSVPLRAKTAASFLAPPTREPNLTLL